VTPCHISTAREPRLDSDGRQLAGRTTPSTPQLAPNRRPQGQLVGHSSPARRWPKGDLRPLTTSRNPRAPRSSNNYGAITNLPRKSHHPLIRSPTSENGLNVPHSCTAEGANVAKLLYASIADKLARGRIQLDKGNEHAGPGARVLQHRRPGFAKTLAQTETEPRKSSCSQATPTNKKQVGVGWFCVLLAINQAAGATGPRVTPQQSTRPGEGLLFFFFFVCCFFSNILVIISSEHFLAYSVGLRSPRPRQRFTEGSPKRRKK